jgi:hypothetical protein
MKEKCIDFLKANGWKEDSEPESDYRSFYKKNVNAIDVSDDEIVLLDDTGDYLHLPVNYYALIGALIHHSQIGIGYKHEVKQ